MSVVTVSHIGNVLKKKRGRNIPFKLSFPRGRELNLFTIFLPNVYPGEEPKKLFLSADTVFSVLRDSVLLC